MPDVFSVSLALLKQSIKGYVGVKFTGEPRQNISNEAKDLITKMLDRDPKT